MIHLDAFRCMEYVLPLSEINDLSVIGVDYASRCNLNDFIMHLCVMDISKCI